MAPFQAKIHKGRQRKRENKNFRSIPFRFHTTRNRKFQKNSNKIQKIKKFMGSFQSKIGWKRLRRRENKNYRSVSFQPGAK